ncbi:MAG: phage major capsid protein, partial [Nitrosotalea sp.]
MEKEIVMEQNSSTQTQNQEVVKDATAQAVSSTSASANAGHIAVKLEGALELAQAMAGFVSAVKESAKPAPQAKVSGTEATQAVQESFEVKEKSRLDKIAKTLREMAYVREDIASSGASGALGQVWSPDMIVLPPDLPANLRRFVQVKEIPKGQKQINFTTITTPAFGALTEDTAPTDISQTISEISVTPSETGAKQRVSYVVMESATPDVVQAVERSFQAAALIDEDNTILTALDGATPADTLYGDETVTTEATITSTMTFKAARLASALREVQKKGYAVGPGDLVAVLHPVQYDGLLKDTAISQYLYFGSVGPIQQAVIPQVYGVDVVRSTKVPTGLGSGSPAITTYHAQVFLKASAKAGPNG